MTGFVRFNFNNKHIYTVFLRERVKERDFSSPCLIFKGVKQTHTHSPQALTHTHTQFVCRFFDVSLKRCVFCRFL